MLSMSLLTENKIASVGAAAIVTGVVILLSASAVDTEPIDDDTDDDDSSDTQMANIEKKKTLLAMGGTIMSIGILAQLYDQYTRRLKSSSSFKMSSSSEMSPAELSKFQERVSTAAAKLRRSIAQTSDKGMPKDMGMGMDMGMDMGSKSTESAAELAARASAQISSFIQNYS